jgi:hypothetical protein
MEKFLKWVNEDVTGRVNDWWEVDDVKNDSTI